MNPESCDTATPSADVIPTPLDELGQLGFEFVYLPQTPSFPPPSLPFS